jgi:hypothetical protein
MYQGMTVFITGLVPLLLPSSELVKQVKQIINVMGNLLVFGPTQYLKLPHNQPVFLAILCV